jgi:hypothetical protein
MRFTVAQLAAALAAVPDDQSDAPIVIRLGPEDEERTGVTYLALTFAAYDRGCTDPEYRSPPCLLAMAEVLG